MSSTTVRRSVGTTIRSVTGASLDHIGIVTTDLEASTTFHRDQLGMTILHDELLEPAGLRAVLLGLGPTRIELLTPVRDGTTVARFLERRGPGLHHLAYRVSGIREAVSSLVAGGLEPLSDEPQVGLAGTETLFFHPNSTQGVLIELVASDIRKDDDAAT